VPLFLFGAGINAKRGSKLSCMRGWICKTFLGGEVVDESWNEVIKGKIPKSYALK